MNLVFRKFDPCMTSVCVTQAVHNMFCAQSQTAEFQFIAQPCTHDIEEKCLCTTSTLPGHKITNANVPFEKK